MVIYTCVARVGTIINIVHPYRAVTYPLYILKARPANVPVIVMNVRIVNDGGIVDDIYHTRVGYIVAVNIRIAHVGLRHANPIVVRFAVATAK